MAVADAATCYDDSGRSFTYDALSMTTGATAPLSIGGTRNFPYIYTADDERIALVEKLAPGGTTTNWTLRGLDNHLLRTWTSSTTGWNWREDDIWRGAALLAYESPTGVRHYGLDHLGSPALLTDATAHTISAITFDAFGNGGATGAGMLQYTGHERDSANVGPSPGTVILPDYLHARFYNSTTGRFLSVDPTLDLKKTLPNPQAWNRYPYARNNPMRFKDPTGKYTCSGSKDDCGAIDNAVADLTAAASKLPKDSSDRTSLNNVIVFLGTANTDNGVHIVVGSGTLPGAAGGTRTVNGITTIGIDLKADSAYASAHNVRQGAELAGTLAHEAQHGFDEKRYGNPTSRSQEKSLELPGYTTEAGPWRGMGVSAPSHIWTRGDGFNPHAVEDWAETATQIWCSSPGAPCN